MAYAMLIRSSRQAREVGSRIRPSVEPPSKNRYEGLPNQRYKIEAHPNLFRQRMKSLFELYFIDLKNI